MCSNVEIKRVICALNARAHEEQEKMKDKEARLMWWAGISRPIPLNERSIQVKTPNSRRTLPKEELGRPF